MYRMCQGKCTPQQRETRVRDENEVTREYNTVFCRELWLGPQLATWLGAGSKPSQAEPNVKRLHLETGLPVFFFF